MANIKVSEMTEATVFDDGDYAMIVQGNQNKKIAKENMLADVGDISNLETTDKSDVVNSINEVNSIATNNAKNNIYSLNEIDTGKIWIDSNPIYRKVIVLSGEDITSQNTNIDHNISNINELLKIDCICITEAGSRQLPTNYYGTSDWDGQLFCTNTQLRFEFGTAVLARFQTASHIYVILEYTKTTD